MSSDKEEIIRQKKIVQPLLTWYAQNARKLPWREDTDPYHIWVSEIMLQQTRVETVKPYFERFMKRLPSVWDLAEITEEELLKLWEGMGYYSRAKNMHKAAQIICTNFGGVFPENFDDILSLPGIGEYTAGAISSIAFQKPIPAVDGNVLRVMSRVCEDGRNMAETAVKKELTELLRKIYPKKSCGDFTQSLMELGAMICLPNTPPKCFECPIKDLCGANQNGTQLNYPVLSQKRERKREDMTAFLLRFKDEIAVCKREKPGPLKGMWELPNTQGILSSKEVEQYLMELGIHVDRIEKRKKRKHIFTHIEWDMQCYAVFCKNRASRFVWVTKEQLDEEIALPTAFRKLLD